MKGPPLWLDMGVSLAFILSFGLVVWHLMDIKQVEADRRAVPDAGVSLHALRESPCGPEALPPRGEVLFFDRNGRTRAKLLDGTWPVRLVVYPMRGGEVRVEVDELGRATVAPEVP